MAVSIEIVAMVYRDPAFLHSIHREILKYQPAWTSWRIVGNDPTDRLIEAASAAKIPLDIYHDQDPTDWYLSRVYRCWNYCVETSPANHICLLNSDMMLSPGWLDALIRRLDGKTLPVSRLVEPCKHRPLWTCEHGLQIDLGRHPSTFPREIWAGIVEARSLPKTEPWGGFMPCLLNRQAVLELGGYPEGNVVNGKAVKPNPALLPEGFMSGDAYLFTRLAELGFAHTTCFDSLVYHMQEGEMCN